VPQVRIGFWDLRHTVGRVAGDAGVSSRLSVRSEDRRVGAKRRPQQSPLRYRRASSDAGPGPVTGGTGIDLIGTTSFNLKAVGSAAGAFANLPVRDTRGSRRTVRPVTFTEHLLSPG